VPDAGYHSGRGHDWFKTKCSDRQEFVVTGFVPSTADAHASARWVLGGRTTVASSLIRPHRHRLHA